MGTNLRLLPSAKLYFLESNCRPERTEECDLRREANMSTRQDHGAELKFVSTNTFIVGDLQRSATFYRDVAAVSTRGRADASVPRQHLAHYQTARRANRRQS